MNESLVNDKKDDSFENIGNIQKGSSDNIEDSGDNTVYHVFNIN